jgi:hypothetical protein
VKVYNGLILIEGLWYNNNLWFYRWFVIMGDWWIVIIAKTFFKWHKKRALALLSLMSERSEKKSFSDWKEKAFDNLKQLS